MRKQVKAKDRHDALGFGQEVIICGFSQLQSQWSREGRNLTRKARVGSGKMKAARIQSRNKKLG